MRHAKRKIYLAKTTEEDAERDELAAIAIVLILIKYWFNIVFHVLPWANNVILPVAIVLILIK